jgi:hypothetical protein
MAERLRLRAQVEEMKSQIMGLRISNNEFQRASVTLRKRLIAAEDDAARYQMLQKDEGVMVVVLDGEAQNLKGIALNKYLDEKRNPYVTFAANSKWITQNVNPGSKSKS